MENQFAEKSSRQRFLITTPINLLKHSGKPILILGEWCRLFQQRNNLKNEGIELHPYHWDDRNKFANDFRYLENLYEEKLALLSISLGNIHGVTTDVRYWRIIIGPWLRFFIDSVFDRYELIRTAQNSGEIYHTSVPNYSLQDWIPSDFNEFYEQFRHDSWNSIIFSECIKELDLSFEHDNELVLPFKKEKKHLDLINRIVNSILEIYTAVLPAKLNKVVMIAAYLPKKKLVNLQMHLKQFPYLISPKITMQSGKRDETMRNKLDLSNSKNQFEKLLDRLICELMPYSYLENFKKFRDIIKQYYPPFPSVIFTANAYQADDGFKIWAAGHVINKVPLVIGQHGGHYGIGLLNQTEDHQIRIADVFTTWGWTDKSKDNVIPMPAMKLPFRPLKYDTNGDILLVTASYPRYFYCHFSVAVAGQFLDYLDEQIRFYKSLDDILKKMIKIRTDVDVFGWKIHDRLKEAGLGESLDISDEKLFSRLKKCRMCVSTYNATVFLETLAANIPTIVFFNPNKYEIREEAAEAMNLLRAVNILHDTPESAAIFLNSLNNNIDCWWKSKIVQEARHQFCEIYANTSPNWINEWKTFFNKIIKS